MLVLLDVGNVLYQIDFDRTRQGLSALPGYNGRDIIFGVDEQEPLFLSFDRGEMSTPEFCQHLREQYGFHASDEDITQAWCALLVAPFPFARHVPANIREVYSRINPSEPLRIALLSNISEPHLAKAGAHLPLLIRPYDYAVDATYFSFQLGLRKPNPAIFLRVCELESVSPQDVVLYDDSALNVQAARGLGIRAVQVKPGDADLAFREPS